jgi:sec-independent protein translocase protein TatB
MFNVGAGEMVLIFVLALIVLGPDKLPGAARQAGRYLAEFRRISSGFQQEFRDAVDSAMVEPPHRNGLGSDADLFRLPGRDARDVQVAPERRDEPTVALAKADDPPPASTPTPGAAPPEVSGRVEVDGPSGSFL